MLADKRSQPRETEHLAFGVVSLYQPVAVEHPAVRRDPVIWGEEDYVLIPVKNAEDEHLALETCDPLRRKIDHGNDLPTHELLRIIVCRELGARFPNPDLRSEGHHELDRRLAGLREMLGLEDRADS